MLIKEVEQHMALIRAEVLQSPEAFFRVCFLAIASMRMHSSRFWGKVLPPAYVEYMMTSDIDSVNKIFPDFAAVSFKRNALRYVEENRDALWRIAISTDAASFFNYLVETVPGVGTAKAAFIVQMTHNQLGCIDSVNIKRYNISNVPATTKGYLRMLEQIGVTPGRMWRDWCEYVAKRDGMFPYRLSEAHALFVLNGRYNPNDLFLQQNLFEV